MHTVISGTIPVSLIVQWSDFLAWRLAHIAILQVEYEGSVGNLSTVDWSIYYYNNKFSCVILMHMLHIQSWGVGQDSQSICSFLVVDQFVT